MESSPSLPRPSFPLPSMQRVSAHRTRVSSSRRRSSLNLLNLHLASRRIVSASLRGRSNVRSVFPSSTVSGGLDSMSELVQRGPSGEVKQLG